MIIEKLQRPYFWKKHDLVVTHDGFHENGLRIHLVQDTPVGVEAHIRDNALVCSNKISEEEVLQWVEHFTGEGT